MDSLNQPSSPQPTIEQTPIPPKPSINSKIPLIAAIVLVIVMIGLISYVLAAKTKPTSQSPTISPSLTQPSPTIDPTANWETYVNPVYGYSVKYPPDWTNANYCQGCTNADPVNHKVGRFFNIDGTNKTAIVLEIIPTTSTTYEIQTNIIKNYSWSNKIVENIYIDGSPGMKMLGNDTVNLKKAAALFQREQYIYKLQTWGNQVDEFDKILSTFKFTDQY